MSLPFSTELQRLRYWQGQLLKSKDLRDQVAYNSMLQAWHNRALHTPYGLRAGYQVDLDGNQAVIQSGIAYDAFGRELVLAETRRLALPEQIPAGGLYLVARSRAGEESANPLECGPAGWSGTAGAAEALRLTWEVPYQFDARLGVPLARLLPGPVLDLDFFPPATLPEAQPRRFYSATLEGNTAWQLWELPEPAGLSPAEAKRGRFARFLGLQVEVDTTFAGFTQTPCYFAWLSGDIWSPRLPGQFTASFASDSDSPEVRTVLGAAIIQLLVLRFGHIAAPTPNSFVYRIWFPQAAKWFIEQEAFNLLLALARQSQITLSWMGIQMDRSI